LLHIPQGCLADLGGFMQTIAISILSLLCLFGFATPSEAGMLKGPDSAPAPAVAPAPQAPKAAPAPPPAAELDKLQADFDKISEQLLQDFPLIKRHAPTCGMVGSNIAGYMDLATQGQTKMQKEIDDALAKAKTDLNIQVSKLSQNSGAVNALAGSGNSGIGFAHSTISNAVKHPQGVIEKSLVKIKENNDQYDQNISMTTYGLSTQSAECQKAAAAYKRMGAGSHALPGALGKIHKPLNDRKAALNAWASSMDTNLVSNAGAIKR
jgi:uncharacterized phage infection (PIP) family protein YhgE